MIETYLPRYREIEQALRERIAGLKPGDPLPSDTELCAEFGVSRMTARNAMQRLAEEGLVEREPGRGSFVAEPLTHRRANTLLSFSNEMRRRGRAPSSRILECRLRPPTPDEAANLQLRDGEAVVCIRRIRIADGDALALESVSLHGRCGRDVLEADLEGGSLHATLIAAGFVPTRGSATIEAQAATVEDTELLGVPEASPLLVERRLILDQRGRPLEWTESRYPADRYALDVAFNVEYARPLQRSRRP